MVDPTTDRSYLNLRGLQDDPNSRAASNPGHPPLHPKLHQEVKYTAIKRLNISLPESITWIQPKDVEKIETRWAVHPSKFPLEEQASIEEGGYITQGIRLYTDGSKTKSGAGAAFCVMENQIITRRWSTKMQNYNLVFQAELLAINYATTSHSNQSQC
ncbi:hypothetical protein AVEN_196433-1 [Araneus ventricosus]|uniref:RNase H type-1 domain-containing protein n=1 Tax=Araneus ventricosus TaxID=182803 RepID=A0A4Y2AWF8_ARAVE|nr:hypothetical protein AVEN_196433-1 [Araneus ventricosus]